MNSYLNITIYEFWNFNLNLKSSTLISFDQLVSLFVPLCQLALRFKIYWITTEIYCSSAEKKEKQKTWPSWAGLTMPIMPRRHAPSRLHSKMRCVNEIGQRTHVEVFWKIASHFVAFIPFSNLMRSIWLFACAWGATATATAETTSSQATTSGCRAKAKAKAKAAAAHPLEIASRCLLAWLPVITRFDNFHGSWHGRLLHAPAAMFPCSLGQQLHQSVLALPPLCPALPTDWLR